MCFIQCFSAEYCVEPDNLGLSAVALHDCPKQLHYRAQSKLAGRLYLTCEACNGGNGLGIAAIAVLQQGDQQPVLGPEVVEQPRIGKPAPICELLDAETVIAAHS